MFEIPKSKAKPGVGGLSWLPSPRGGSLTYLAEIPRHLVVGTIPAFILIPIFVRFEMLLLFKGREKFNAQTCPCDCRNDTDWTCHIYDSFATVPKEGRCLKETFENGSTANGSASESMLGGLFTVCSGLTPLTV